MARPSDKCVGSDMSLQSSRDEQLYQRSLHILVLEPVRDDEREAFAAGLIFDRKDPRLATNVSTQSEP